jgi:hypothetical protein
MVAELSQLDTIQHSISGDDLLNQTEQDPHLEKFDDQVKPSASDGR